MPPPDATEAAGRHSCWSSRQKIKIDDMKGDYLANDLVRELRIIDLTELEREAARVIGKGAMGYIRGGAGDEWTMRRNTACFDERPILPRVLASLAKPDTKCRILGIDLPFPIIMAPVAAQGLAHVSAEAGTARGTAEAGTIMCVSTYAGMTLEEIALAGNGAPQWFQFYPSKDAGFNRHLLDQALAGGYRAVVLTADATVGGNREADLRNRFVFPLKMANLEQYGSGQGRSIEQIYADAMQQIGPAEVERIAAYTRLPVIVKGIQAPEDALRAIDAGAAGVQVSNHGGRQLDGGPGSFEALPAVARAVNGRVPVIFDSRIRRGQHIFKALASGADVVAIGRPAIYGLALGGWMGVRSVFEFFRHELEMVMQLAGTPDIEAVKKTRLFDPRADAQAGDPA